jgi:arginyl-tRNA synthetase
MEHLKEAFRKALAEALPGQDVILERPRSGEIGDAAYPCFRAAKSLGVNPIST